MATQLPAESSWAFKALVWASKLIPTGLVLPIVRGPLRGARWIVGAGAGEGRGLSALLNMSETAGLAKAASLAAAATGVCFDIGANTGIYSLLFSRFCRHVYAFEPLPRNLRFLHRTLEVNSIANVTIVPCAVADRLALRKFQVGRNCAEGKVDAGGSEPVVTVSCDEFSALFAVTPDLVKIDVEGAEMEVLRGAEATIARRPPHLLLQTHSDALRTECLAFLRAKGYSQIEALDGKPLDAANDFAVISPALPPGA